MATETGQKVDFEIRDGLHGRVVGRGSGETHYEGNPSQSFPPMWVTYEGKECLVHNDVEGAGPYIIAKK
jgi:hypothetical protein